MSLSNKIHLRENERIIRVVKRYGLADVWKYLLGLAFMFAASLFMFYLVNKGWWGRVAYGATMLIGVYIIIRTWFFNHLNTFVITSERVVDIHRLSWFDEILSSVGFTDLKDIAVRRKGFFANAFNYGSLSILSKSQQFILEVIKVYRPQEIQSLISEVCEIYKRDRHLGAVQDIYRGFLRIIPELADEDLHKARRLIDEQFETNEEETIV